MGYSKKENKKTWYITFYIESSSHLVIMVNIFTSFHLN